MKKKSLSKFLSFLILLSLFSCKKQDSALIKKTNQEVAFPTTEKEKQTVAVLKEVGQILQSVYRKPDARFEVNAAIKTGYYVDERVLLKDLLFPENSPLYNSDKFRASKAKKGVFKTFFLDFLSKGDYPNLKAAMGWNNINAREFAENPGVDTTNEIWTNQYGVSIYFPYSENFTFIDPTDPTNNTEYGNLVTIVYADREADSAPGWEPYHDVNPDPLGFQCMDNICYRPVTIDDDYAEGHPTHIVGVGAEPARVMTDPPPPSTNTNRVFLGWGRINNRKQYDNLISFNSQNGGGSEIEVCRISGYLKFQDQQVTDFQNQFEVNFNRKEVHNGTWKRVYGVWDPAWVADNTEQVIAIYEEDNEGTQTFSGSLGTTVKLDSGGSTINGSIGYNIVVKTKDELILQQKYSRVAYFGAAKSDQGWGFQLCDNRKGSCRYDNTFLTSGNWPQYNGGANWNYTWPYHSY